MPNKKARRNNNRKEKRQAPEGKLIKYTDKTLKRLANITSDRKKETKIEKLIRREEKNTIQLIAMLGKVVDAKEDHLRRQEDRLRFLSTVVK